MLRKKSNGGDVLLKRRICAVKSVRLGSASTAVNLMFALVSSCATSVRAASPTSFFSAMIATFLKPAAAIHWPMVTSISDTAGALRNTSG